MAGTTQPAVKEGKKKVKTPQVPNEPNERKKGDAPRLSLDDPGLYGNRELGLLACQWRGHEEAKDPANPIIERAKVLSIVGSNLDEFFMVRVAGLSAQKDAGILEFGPD